jgi:peptidoglycan/LPS O-acetylase OafA/YrhL
MSVLILSVAIAIAMSSVIWKFVERKGRKRV